MTAAVHGAVAHAAVVHLAYMASDFSKALDVHLHARLQPRSALLEGAHINSPVDVCRTA
jgi:hypothetical protein